MFSDSSFHLIKTVCFLNSIRIQVFPTETQPNCLTSDWTILSHQLNSFNFMFSFPNFKWNLRNISPISVGHGCPASLPTCVQRDRSPPRPLMSFSARNSFWEHRAIFRSSSCKKQYQWDYGLCIFHWLGRSYNAIITVSIVSLFAHSLLRRPGTTVLFWIARVGEWRENREWQWWQLSSVQFSLFTLVYNIYTVYSNERIK